MAITAAKLMVEVGADTAAAERGLKSFSDKMANNAKSMAVMGGGLSLALTAPLLGVAKSALTLAADYEQSMNILQQVTGATEGQMSSLSDQALHLGAVTSFSAGEAATAMLELGKAGLETEEIMAAIPGVLDLAAAGGVSLGEAANLTASTLNAFNLEAAESARIANIMAAAANASAADISDLSQGMMQAGFAFNLAGQPVENLAASLAILTNVGLTGSDAGTALKNAFMRMMNPTKEASSLMRELGISFYDASGNMKQLPDIIGMINTATAGLTNQQRDAALSTIFLSDGMKAIIPLLDAGTEGFNKTVGAVAEVGAATKVSDALMKGLSGGIEYLMGSVESFLIGAALPFLDTLGGIARSTGDAVTWFGALPQPIINAALAFGAVLAAAGPLMLVMSGVAAVLAFLATPLGLVVAASAALAAAWAADMGGIQGATASAMGNVQAGFNATLAAAQRLGDGIAAAFANTSFPSLETLWTQFQAGDFQRVADTLRTATYELMVNLDAELNITAQANQLKQQLVGAVNGLGAAVANLDFNNVSANVNGLRDGILSGMTAAINGIDWSQGGSTFAGMVSGLAEAVNGLDLSAIDWSAVLTRVLLGPLGAAINAISWVISSEDFAGLQSAVRGAIGEIEWGEFGTSFIELGTAITTQLGAIFTDMGNDIGKLFTGFTLPKLSFDPVRMIQGLTDSINNQNWEAMGASFVTNITNAVTNAFTNMGGIIAAVNAWGASVDAALNAWATNAAQTIAASFTGLGAAFAQLGAALNGALTGFLTGARDSITDIASRAVDSLSAGVAAMWTDFTANLEALDWQEYVQPLAWLAFVSTLSWTNFVTAISWASFVPDISWENFVPSFGWDDFIPSLDWGRFISWLNIPGNATGTPHFQGGLSWVGERGPELVSLPRGTRIYNNQDSMAMAAGGGGVTVHVNVASMASDIDVEAMANRIARIIQRRTR